MSKINDKYQQTLDLQWEDFSEYFYIAKVSSIIIKHRISIRIISFIFSLLLSIGLIFLYIFDLSKNQNDNTLLVIIICFVIFIPIFVFFIAKYVVKRCYRNVLANSNIPDVFVEKCVAEYIPRSINQIMNYNFQCDVAPRSMVLDSQDYHFFETSANLYKEKVSLLKIFYNFELFDRFSATNDTDDIIIFCHSKSAFDYQGIKTTIYEVLVLTVLSEDLKQQTKTFLGVISSLFLLGSKDNGVEMFFDSVNDSIEKYKNYKLKKYATKANKDDFLKDDFGFDFRVKPLKKFFNINFYGHIAVVEKSIDFFGTVEIASKQCSKDFTSPFLEKSSYQISLNDFDKNFSLLVDNQDGRVLAKAFQPRIIDRLTNLGPILKKLSLIHSSPEEETLFLITNKTVPMIYERKRMLDFFQSKNNAYKLTQKTMEVQEEIIKMIKSLIDCDLFGNII